MLSKKGADMGFGKADMVWVDAVCALGQHGEAMTDEDVTSLMELMPKIFRAVTEPAGYSKRAVQAVIVKFRDAGRRTPPTRQFSSILPGRPQTGADGNRTRRWLLPSGHKYFALQRDAELVEIRYYLQALSMDGAPRLGHPQFENAFWWLLGHEVLPGEYRDPIFMRPIGFKEFLQSPKVITSGHLNPLGRGGRHEPSNTYLMLARSNTMQNDLTFDEFLALIADIQIRQAAVGVFPDSSKVPTNEFLESGISPDAVTNS